MLLMITFLNKNILKKEFELFIEKESFWIDYTANFLLLKKIFKNKSWIDFSEDFKNYENISAKWKKENKYELDRIKFEQFLFFYQWGKIRNMLTPVILKLSEIFQFLSLMILRMFGLIVPYSN